MATILVVDDDEPVREFLAAALELGGHRVLQAHHGRNALDMIADSERGRPDLVIADVMMPVVGGVELCRILKGDPATTAIPFVLMSAAIPHATINDCADAYIGKPFDLDAMDALVGQLLSVSRNRPMDQTASS